MQGPTTRVLALLELLQARGRLSGSQLARALGVDGRTLRRYIVMLEELGVPISSERGRHGGYQLVAGYKLPPMMFTDDEALALALGLLAARGLGLADAAPAVASAQAKLERVMPRLLQQRVRAVDETIALELPRAQSGGDNAALVTLSAAAQTRQRVHLRYRAPDNASTARDFDPYGLAWRGGRWYVVGHCHLRRDVRSFRIDRIEQVRSMADTFLRPPDFDALAYLAHSIATLKRTHGIEVLLHTDLATARRELFDAIGLLEPVDDGVLLSAQADDLDWFARELARLPFEFSVRSPVELREALAVVGKRLLGLAS
ncbi:MAG: YafY family transcriptional regulator [Metallibacterium scheffleri]|jgi:predicted DNA-binding transcriptional regulator YafY|uniref:helix-turn-helix transcriptional regulator n=1 Tax=Metallibacterium scheffleri TaxID=993689 RepID=UPI0026F226AD|nr:YafY family protein [Metallibacterium scheffleri]MCK9368343.1 YafY family transcriptional regulator [Metallibacterium scheffleri]